MDTKAIDNTIKELTKLIARTKAQARRVGEAEGYIGSSAQMALEQAYTEMEGARDELRYAKKEVKKLKRQPAW